jgi:hypothetical protein
MPYIGNLRTLGLAKETTIGTFVLPPTVTLNYVPPASFSPAIALALSKGIYAVADKNVKAVQVKADLKGMKLKLELEPLNCPQILQACFGNDTVTGSSPYTHTFVRQAVNQLPTYTAYLDQGATYTAIGGCMLDKLDLNVKAGEPITLDTEWTGMTYESTSQATMPAISALQPLDASTAAITVGGSGITDYDNLKLSIDNMVKADHVVNASIYPGKIYSEGMSVKFSMDMYVESGNIAQWTTDYLTGVSQAVVLTITSPQIAVSSTHYSLTLTMPVLKYQTAPFANAQAVLKIPFAGVALYDLGSTNKSITAVLVNNVSTAY